MTSTPQQPVLVTGATGRVGRNVVAELLGAGVPVRALTRRPDAAALSAGVEVVAGDLTAPESLDAALRGVAAVFLVWTAPPATAPAVVERLAKQARRVVFLSSPHQTPHPFFQQPIGHPAFVTATVADVTGVPARTFRQWADDYADAFQKREPLH